MNKTYELKFTLVMNDDTNEEFKEFKNDILSGKMQREMFDDNSKNKLGIKKIMITLLEKK